MHIDCDRCVVRGVACEGCVDSALLAGPAEVEWDDTERAALATLAKFGLVPPLRLQTDTGLPECEANHQAISA
jgi:hypothetical protein